MRGMKGHPPGGPFTFDGEYHGRTKRSPLRRPHATRHSLCCAGDLRKRKVPPSRRAVDRSEDGSRPSADDCSQDPVVGRVARGASGEKPAHASTTPYRARVAPRQSGTKEKGAKCVENADPIQPHFPRLILSSIKSDPERNSHSSASSVLFNEPLSRGGWAAVRRSSSWSALQRFYAAHPGRSAHTSGAIPRSGQSSSNSTPSGGNSSTRSPPTWQPISSGVRTSVKMLATKSIGSTSRV